MVLYSFTTHHVPEAAPGSVNKALNQRGVLASISLSLGIEKQEQNTGPSSYPGKCKPKWFILAESTAWDMGQTSQAN